MRSSLAPFQWRMNLSSAMLISGIIHLLLILTLPGFTISQFNHTKPYIEVSLLPPAQLIKRGASPAPPKKGGQIGAIKWQALAPQLPSSNQYYRAGSYRPAVRLPVATNKQEVINLLAEEPFSVDGLPKAPLSAPASSSVSTPVTPELSAGSPRTTSPEISWSGPPRGYLYKPPNPRYTSKIEGEVGLKFWVDPQGNVASVVVLRKLDAQLEGLAIDYMKRWRFEPLNGKGQEMQWGIINIKFRLE